MLLNIVNTTSLVVMAGLMLIIRLEGYSVPEGRAGHGQRERLFLWVFTAAATVYLLSIVVIFFSGDAATSGEWTGLVNLVMVPLFCVYGYYSRRAGPGQSSVVLAMLGLVVIVIHSLGTHAATQPGLIPLISQVIHLLVVTLFTGLILWSAIYTGLTVMAAQGQADERGLPGLNSRTAGLTLLLLVVIVISGSILSVANVHSTAVLDGTQYGQLLKLKTGLVVLLFTLLLIGLLQGLPSADAKGTLTGALQMRRRPWRNGAVSLLLLAIILITGMITSLQSPDTGPFLNPQRWKLNAGSHEIDIDMQPVAGSTNHVRFEIFLPEALMQPPSTQVGFNLYMPGSQTGMFDAEALQVSQTSYQGEAMFPGPGDWRLELEILRPTGPLLETAVDFSVPAQPLVSDLRTYLSLAAITYNRANLLTFIIGLALLGVYSLIILQCRKGTASRWTIVIALAGSGLGIYMIMSVTLVKTYPSTYWENPVPYTASAIRIGEARYMESCADCHAEDGRGDGPWAIENRGMIPDLGSTHMDVHTDGEIYWWITHGIPSLEMPAVGEEISGQERWSIIHYVRSLRHGVPSE